MDICVEYTVHGMLYVRFKNSKIQLNLNRAHFAFIFRARVVNRNDWYCANMRNNFVVTILSLKSQNMLILDSMNDSRGMQEFGMELTFFNFIRMDDTFYWYRVTCVNFILTQSVSRWSPTFEFFEMYSSFRDKCVNEVPYFISFLLLHVCQHNVCV